MGKAPRESQGRMLYTNFKRLMWKHIGRKAMHEELELYHTEKEIPLAHLEEVRDQVNSGEYDEEFFEKQGLSGDTAFHQAIQQHIPSDEPASSPFHSNTTTPQPSSPPSPKPSPDIERKKKEKAKKTTTKDLFQTPGQKSKKPSLWQTQTQHSSSTLQTIGPPT
ncbi:hypothetical protein QOT17_025193 [Balamuthia mandrillaris]